MSTEEWRFVPGFAPYQVSSHGRVRRNGVIKAPILDPRMYHRFVLSICDKRTNLYAHKLVLITFVGPAPPGMECRHLDGNSLNNHVENLAWGTCLENQRDKFAHGTANVGARNGQAKITPQIVRELRTLYQPGDRTFGACALARRYGISQSAVSSVVTRGSWRSEP